MAITNQRPKETIETIVHLAEISRTLTLFEKYGLEKLIKDAYALSEVEQAKANEAKNNISHCNILIAEQKNRQKQNDDDYAVNEEKARQLSEEWKKLAKEAGELKQWESDVKKQAEELKQSKALIIEREKAIDVKESKLAEAKTKLEATQKEANKIVSELKSRADKMKGLAEGL